MRPLSVRAKLTLWYLVLTSLALAIFGVVTYATLRFALLHLKQSSLLRREQRLMLFLEQQKQGHALASISDQLQNYAVITHEGNLVEIRRNDGSLLFPLTEAGAAWLKNPATNCGVPVFVDLVADGQPTTVMCHSVMLDGNSVRLYMGGSLEDNIYILTTFRNALLFLLPCLLGLSSVSGFLLSRRAMRPVDQMTKSALGIGINNLSARLPEPAAHDELWSLTVAWNQLLGRLERAVSRLSNFSADASHDLRTSITVILATAQLSLHRHRTEEEYRDDLARIVTECRTASTLLDALLSLARSDNFAHEVALKRINACELAVASCRRVEDLSESSGILLDWRLPREDAFVMGDELLLQRLLGILLDNAIKYTPESGEILVEVAQTDAKVSITVRDTGIGMSESVRQHIFDRFYQGDLRDHKQHAGNGLGLAIAKWIAEAHRAVLTVRSVPTQGSEFAICFPAISSPHLPDTRQRDEATMALP